MIRINLLTVDRGHVKRKAKFEATQKITVASSLILVAAALFVGWWYWSLQQQSAELDQRILDAQRETARLKSLITQVDQFEEQRAQLQARVGLIEQLRKGQSGPVHMLDQISRAMPPMVWLTELKQTPASNEVLIEGRCTSLTGLSDFMANLESSGYFRRSVEIVSSTNQSAPSGELIKFQIKAVFQTPGDDKPVATAARGGA